MPKQTRENILKIGIQEFSSKGYQLTTTRDILEKADANVAAISYYFKNKDGLYEEILKMIFDKLNSAVCHILNTKIDTLSPADQEALLREFIHKFVNFIFSKGIDSDICKIYIREYVDPSECYKKIFTHFNDSYRKFFINFLMQFSHLSQKEATLKAMMIYSFFFILHTRKSVMLEAMNWKGYNEKAQSEVENMLLHMITSK